jgi:hypothetical protein
MSTQSQLRFIQRSEPADKQSDTNRIAQIYRHSDGYPDSVVRDLVQLKHLLDETRTERGPAYAAAQFLFLDTLSTMIARRVPSTTSFIRTSRPSSAVRSACRTFS